MKTCRYIILLILLHLNMLVHADFIEIMQPGHAQLEDKTPIHNFLCLIFDKISDTTTWCYAVAQIGDNSIKAIKTNIKKYAYSWYHESKFNKPNFKTKNIDFFGVVGLDKICALNNGDIYITQLINNKKKWRPEPIKLRKYTDEVITSCTGLSIKNFWITILDKKTHQNSIVLASEQENNYTYTATPYVGISITPDKQNIWFIKKDAKSNKYSVEITEFSENEPFTQSSSIDSEAPLNMALINNFTALDETEAYFMDINHKNIYTITPEGTVSLFTTSKQPLGALSILNNKLIVTIGNRLYTYAKPSETLHVTVKGTKHLTPVKRKSEHITKKIDITEAKQIEPIIIEEPTITLEEPLSQLKEHPIIEQMETLSTKEPSLAVKAIAYVKTMFVKKPVSAPSTSYEQAKPNIVPKATRQITTTSTFQKFRNWLGIIAAQLWGTKTEAQRQLASGATNILKTIPKTQLRSNQSLSKNNATKPTNKPTIPR